MNRDRNPQFKSVRMEQARVTSSLVMDVETCAEKRSDHLFGFENRKPGRHALEGLRDGDRYALGLNFSYVVGNSFAGL